MPRIAIDDLQDPRLAIYRDLKRSNQTRDLKQFVVEGAKLARRLASSRFPLVSVLTTDRAEGRVRAWLPPDATLFIVPHKAISDLVGYHFHLGILACGERRDWPPLDDLIAAAGPTATLVACPDVQNPDNLGSLVRLADVFGATAVLAGGRCPDPLSRRVLRVSMGTALQTPVYSKEDLRSELDRLRRRWGFQLVAAVTDPEAEPLPRAARPARLALLFGNESEGLAPDWLACCDRQITIPMRPGADSLNVAVAAGIVLYHFSRCDPEPP